MRYYRLQPTGLPIQGHETEDSAGQRTGGIDVFLSIHGEATAREYIRLVPDVEALLRAGRQLRADARVIVAEGHGALLVIEERETYHDGDRWLDRTVENAYSLEDWNDTCASSYAFDDGYLRAHDGERCYGDAIRYREGTVDDLGGGWLWADFVLLPHLA